MAVDKKTNPDDLDSIRMEYPFFMDTDRDKVIT